jgi:hypothetical protein
MPYVSRDDSGNITGCFANKQPGFAEEYLPDDDPEVLAFLEAQDATPPPSEQDEVLFDHENRLRSLEGEPALPRPPIPIPAARG